MNLPAKSHQAAKIKLTKLNKAYNEAIAARNEISHEPGGWNQDRFARHDAAEKVMASIYAEMEAFRDACKAVGWYVTSSWLRYFEQNPSLHANRD